MIKAYFELNLFVSGAHLNSKLKNLAARVPPDAVVDPGFPWGRLLTKVVRKLHQRIWTKEGWGASPLDPPL